MVIIENKDRHAHNNTQYNIFNKITLNLRIDFYKTVCVHIGKPSFMLHFEKRTLYVNQGQTMESDKSGSLPSTVVDALSLPLAMSLSVLHTVSLFHCQSLTHTNTKHSQKHTNIQSVNQTSTERKPRKHNL